MFLFNKLRRKDNLLVHLCPWLWCFMIRLHRDKTASLLSAMFMSCKNGTQTGSQRKWSIASCKENEWMQSFSTRFSVFVFLWLGGAAAVLEWFQDLADLCMHPPGLQVRTDLAGAGSMGMFWSHSLQGLFSRYSRPKVAQIQNSG